MVQVGIHTLGSHANGVVGLNRLTAAHYVAATSQTSNGRIRFDGTHDYSTGYGYDLNGNVTSLTRKGVNSCITVAGASLWSFGNIDNLSLSYDGNQLRKVTDQCADLTYAGAMDFKDGADESCEYLWDANGNMTRDRNKDSASVPSACPEGGVMTPY